MPTIPHSFLRAFLLLGLISSIIFCPSCRKPQSAPTPKDTGHVAPELQRNELQNAPSTSARNEVTAPVRWQPFLPESFVRARDAKRLIFAFVYVPYQSDYHRVLNSLYQDEILVRNVNESFVPMLIDANESREIGQLAAILCAEIKRPFSMPFFLWLTPEGDPVAWIPINPQSPSLRQLFDQTSNMVNHMWRENPDYVRNNSKTDNQLRAERFRKLAEAPEPSSDPSKDTFLALRELCALYDPGSRTFDQSGGVFPSSTIETLAATSLTPDPPAALRTRASQTLNDLERDLITSAMIDPLDGAIYYARRNSTWSLPHFSTDCQSLARAITALCLCQKATNTPETLNRALAALAYAEKNYLNTDGTFSLGTCQVAPTESWLWRLEEVERLLTPQELKLVTSVFGLKGLGNIPPEIDPNREFFRLNSLSILRSPRSLAPTLNLTPDEADALYESARKKLLKQRSERFPPLTRDTLAHAGSTFRMASAYAAAYTATGDDSLRRKASTTLDHARETFSVGPRLRNTPSQDGPHSPGRAQLYGVAIQATLDVAAINLDTDLHSWAEDLASTAAESFFEQTALVEAPKDFRLIPLPITDRAMLFDDSSYGLLSAAETRLHHLGRQVPGTYLNSVVPLPATIAQSPTIHTDLLLASLIRQHGPTVLLSPQADLDLQTAVSRLPLRGIARRFAIDSDAVPEKRAKVVFSTQQSIITSDSASLLPSILSKSHP